ncbi:ABC transporter ATP-binding protein [Pedobacter sp. AW1-32]|uniref:ABC transporter ATP-binding protein n=1 Tax=Pedobacter sp. AW1-32 TaxID=3383026 RepID=UPI003FF068B7
MEKSPSVKKPSIFSLLASYRSLIILLIVFALLSNGINLLLPKIIAHGIDSFENKTFRVDSILLQFTLAIVSVFIFTYLQSVVQTYASEKVAKDLRSQLSDQISRQSHAYVIKANPARLLTNLTSDVDSIKMFVSQAIVSIASSIFLIVGASILLLMINWKLALCVIAIVPLIGGAFYYVLSKVRVLFKKSREVIDWLNKVISESILGAALIRVINSQQLEYDKFIEANSKARDLGLSILRLFAGLIPIIIFVANLAGLTILVLGGHFVITDKMTLGEFAAFSSYLTMILFPILVIGFMSNVIAQATASYQRIEMVLNAEKVDHPGTIEKSLSGELEARDISLSFGQKPVLKNVSFAAKKGSKTAILGPTAAGKTQLLYMLTGLVDPTSGLVCFDGQDINQYNQEHFYKQIGFVFQDSIMFNMSIRENIAFSTHVSDAALAKAVETAELKDFVNALPDQLDTLVSERGNSLSGGQKQRIMLARALAVDPKILLLDDFTARVDPNTEKRILNNIEKNYPDLTLISVTQKIASVQNYDQVILLMQGEIVARGTHAELLANSPEYVQIYNSQQSTSNYELQS